MEFLNKRYNMATAIILSVLFVGTYFMLTEGASSQETASRVCHTEEWTCNNGVPELDSSSAVERECDEGETTGNTRTIGSESTVCPASGGKSIDNEGETNNGNRGDSVGSTYSSRAIAPPPTHPSPPSCIYQLGFESDCTIDNVIIAECQHAGIPAVCTDRGAAAGGCQDLRTPCSRNTCYDGTWQCVGGNPQIVNSPVRNCDQGEANGNVRVSGSSNTEESLPCYTPGRVGTLTFGTTTTNQINLRWTPVTGATSYDVLYRIGNGNYTSTNVRVTGTTATVTRLTAGTRYTFRARAKNGSKIGAWSTPQIHSTSPSPPPPTPTALPQVGNVTFFNTTTANSIELRWDAVSVASGYDVQHKVTGTSDSTYSNSDVDVFIREASARVSNLIPNTQYTFRVRATNSGEEGEWSSEQSKWTLLAPVGTITFGEATDSINLSWTATPNTASYEIEYRTGNRRYTSTDVTVTGTIVTATVTSLEPGTQYTFLVRGRDGNKMGAWSTPQTHSTLRAPVGTITFGEATDSIDLSWNAIPGVSSYELHTK